MKLKGLISTINILIISAAILLCTYIISDSLKGRENIAMENEILTENELANYLSISPDELDEIIQKDTNEKTSLKNGTNSWDTYHFIPYTNFNGEKRFLKSEIKKWLEYQSSM
ncbi:hypothetical protein ABES80_07850 [Bacillus gobiensis]|uniref:hypothetical protein n=1 Tax=Bacillus gobiensis TaxID=1441095 RepID=UPI003D200293